MSAGERRGKESAAETAVDEAARERTVRLQKESDSSRSYPTPW